MFLKKYLSEMNYNLLLDKYYEDYLESLDEINFLKVYQLFYKYHFYFIEDIIVGYLEIFTFDVSQVEKKICFLKETLGENYINIIGNDMSYLSIITDEE